MTPNEFFVSCSGKLREDGKPEALAILNLALASKFTPEQAVGLAAWLLVLADMDEADKVTRGEGAFPGRVLEAMS